MDVATLYDEDFHAWSEQQAAVLRGLAGKPLALPNTLDLEHVAEEIEDLGVAQRAAVKDLLLQLFIHLIKLVILPEMPAVAHWARKADTFRDQAANRYSPSMRQRIDLDALWHRAVTRVKGELERENDDARLRAALARVAALACPFGLDDLLAGTPRTEYLADLIRAQAERDGVSEDR